MGVSHAFWCEQAVGCLYSIYIAQYVASDHVQSQADSDACEHDCCCRKEKVCIHCTRQLIVDYTCRRDLHDIYICLLLSNIIFIYCLCI